MHLLPAREGWARSVLGPPLSIVFIASAVLLPALGSHGYWEPQELALADALSRGDTIPSQFVAWIGSGTSLSPFRARLPFAAAAIITVLLLYLAGSRLAGRRAGVLAALSALSMSELVFGAGLLTSHIGSSLGAAAICAGGAGLLVADRSVASQFADAALMFVGWLVTLWDGGLIVGAAPALLGVAAGASAARRGWTLGLCGSLLIATGIASLSSAENIEPLAATRWAEQLEPLVYGAFPWIAAAPVAVVWAKRGPAASLALGWSTAAAVCFVAGCLFTGATAPVFAPAVALLVGVGLTRSRVSANRAAPAFVAIITVLLAFDLKRNPEALYRLVASGPYPSTAPEWMGWLPILFGLVFAVGLAWALGRGSRRATVVAVVVGLLFGASTSWLWMPEVGRLVSSHGLFDTFAQHSEEGDTLLIEGVEGPAPELYSPGAYRYSARSEVLDALTSPATAFAIAPRAAACEVHQALAVAERRYAVIAETDDHLLYTNRPPPTVEDRSPLATVLSRHHPVHIGDPLAIRFEHVELIGVELPRTVRRGEEIEATLFLRVLSPPGRDWRVFVHVDGLGHRFQGDHHPIEELCGASRWRAGDYVTDRFAFDAGDLFSPAGTYRVYVGFYVGAPGNWTNMAVQEGAADDNNRALLGTIELR